MNTILEKLDSVNFRHVGTIGISVFLVTLMFPGPSVTGALVPKAYTGPVVISLGTDLVIGHATDQIRSFIPNAAFVTVTTLDQLQAITRNAVREIVYVGHGQPQGLEVGSTLITWQQVQSIVEQSPSQVQLFAACYSLAVQVRDKLVFGFKSLVDVDEAAMWVTSVYFELEHQIAMVPQVLGYFYTILLDKIVNPQLHLLAFLGSTSPSPSIIYCLGARPLCGGGGGGGTYYPTCNNIGQLINGYCVAYINGIWHDHWNTAAANTVYYTHPDVHVYNTWIGYDTQATFVGSNLVAVHLTKTALTAYDISAIISTVIAGALAGAAIGTAIGGPLGTAIGALVGALIAATGAIAQIIVDSFVRDETGAGWGWLHNWYNVWYGSGSDIKIGSIMWFTFGVTLGIPFAYPAWYGGQDLGVGGW